MLQLQMGNETGNISTRLPWPPGGTERELSRSGKYKQQQIVT